MKVVTAGESHGEKLVVIVEDVPYGIPLQELEINFELERRSKCYGRSQRQDAESNSAHIVSGVANGKTTGAPVCIEIANACSSCTAESAQDNFIPRPGHADLPAAIKLGIDDLSTIRERASARETAAIVVAGTIAKNMLAQLGAEVYSFTTAVGSMHIDLSQTLLESDLPTQAQIEVDPLRCPDSNASKWMQEEIDRATEGHDTLGGNTFVVAVGLPIGLGSYTQAEDKLDSQIAAALISINSAKSVEFGNAKYSSANVGSAVCDQLVNAEKDPFKRATNYAGGIEGGLTNGMPLVAQIAIKPVPTVGKPMHTINLDTMEQVSQSSNIRHDTCVVPAVGVIAEAELAIVLVNAFCKKFGSDSITDIIGAYDAYKTKLNLRIS